ncbi:DUF2817 domain-containing protein [Rhabdothermincola sediminis]|uniref:DUF2817 domain-containing protein n=1 Tax=Rhabdothermincola sediminis TaxID=2751370 RepID=UPI001AA06F9F|nr:DUF2817 domain-containing protein [Rhabdothermincola sediminis]
MTAGGDARADRLPLTYDECRARFLHVLARRGLQGRSHPIAARGPEGQRLTIDVVHVGAARPSRALLVLSGVHGVEGFLGSALQCDLLDRLDPAALPGDTAVLLVHAVNPWGMAWWRRQNESNVDLNRNWRRDQHEPPPNDAYDELHPLACPDTPTMPSVDDLLSRAVAVVAERGMPWVRAAITSGQYRHPDGLHYGGARTEESNRILEQVVVDHLGEVERLFTVDLHTGHGPRGEVTALSDQPPGSAQDRFLREALPRARVEPTIGNPGATAAPKTGQIANGIGGLLGGAVAYATSLEIGTAGDEEQLVATYLEQWVHRRGDRHDPEHAAAVWAYRCCFTPDDPEWERRARTLGAEQLDDALAAVLHWS